MGETCLVMPRAIFDETGGWAGGFWYAHEGIELAWRVWDTGHHVWYAGDMRIGHPVVDPRRHEEFYRLNARNRVWLARRNLRWPFSWVYVSSWALLECMRFEGNQVPFGSMQADGLPDGETVLGMLVPDLNLNGQLIFGCCWLGVRPSSEFFENPRSYIVPDNSHWSKS